MTLCQACRQVRTYNRDGYCTMCRLHAGHEAVRKPPEATPSNLQPVLFET